MLDRTILAVIGGVVAFFITLLSAWLFVTAIAFVGWQIPFAAGVAVFVALWFIDWLTDEMTKRNER